jgi:hypothetical protein
MFLYQRLKRFLIILTFLIISGCSIITLGYNRLPLLTIIELNSIFDLTDEQEKLAKFLKTELLAKN